MLRVVFSLVFATAVVLGANANAATMLDQRLDRALKYLEVALTTLRSAGDTAKAYEGKDNNGAARMLAERIDELWSKKHALSPLLREYVSRVSDGAKAENVARTWSLVQRAEAPIGPIVSGIWQVLEQDHRFDQIIGPENRTALGQLLYRKGIIREALGTDEPPSGGIDMMLLERLADENDALMREFRNLAVNLRKIAERN